MVFLIILKIFGKRKINEMSSEIERKFKVVTEKLPDLSNLISTWISQTYLWKNPEIRVRISKKNKKVWATLTVKSKSFFSRFEKNFSIPLWLADRLFPFGIDTVMKERFLLPRREKQDYFWELDRYISKFPFWLAEIELENKNEFVFCPDWVGEEVTFDDRYYAQNIARTLEERINGTFKEE
jgi:CYTH domain-containing protein